MSYKPFTFNDPKLYHPKREEFKRELAEDEDFKKIYTSYERIGNTMLDLCGHPNFDKYITDLIHDTREGQRQGFPEAIGLSIMKVSRLHDQWMAS